jgi:hypothetical protein
MTSSSGNFRAKVIGAAEGSGHVLVKIVRHREFSENLRSDKFPCPPFHRWGKQLLSETIVGDSIFPENQNLQKANSITAFFKKQLDKNPPVKYSSVSPPQNSLFKELSLPRL